ncbi:bifunctional lysylphosphatidylglycerol flippase/synthetase MprF [Scopulibacillus cellulosilyticus]|uniref:Phosphatidylglycerol lysyltransferase n=1 Tax=Scopulibacillus cellulosilyticus TaxID=2665665 RepID=A0ABW2Q0W3_9BACL
MSSSIMKRITNIFKIIFPIFLILFIFFQGKRELSHISIRKSFVAIKELHAGGFILTVIVGLLAVSVMCFYDYFLTRSLDAKIPLSKVFRVSWVANSFNNIIGFGGLAGVGLRSMLYRDHVEEGRGLLKSIAWMTPAVMNGLSILLWFVLFNVFPVRAVLHNQPWLWIAVIGVILIAPAYLIYSIVKRSKNISFKVSAQFTITSLAEWTAAALVLFVIFQLVHIPLSFVHVMGIFTIAGVAGLISLVPGGFGSFDLMILIGAEAFHADQGTVLTALLIYRLVYYFIPFIVGLIFAALEMSETIKRKVEDHQLFMPAVETTGVLWKLQRLFLQKLANLTFPLMMICISGTIFFSVSIGVILLRYEVSSHLYFRIFFFLYMFLFGCGLILLFLVHEMYMRTKRVYYMVSIILILTAILGIFTISLLVSLIILLVLVGLFLKRSSFVRESYPFSFATIGRTVVLAILALSVYLKSSSLVLELLNQPHKLNFVFYGIAMGALIFAVVYILIFEISYNKIHHRLPGEDPDFEKLKDFLEKNGGNALSHLGYLGDKRFFFSSDNKAMLQFAKSGHRLIVLGDPAGQPESFGKILQEFHDAADYYGYTIILYQIDGENMAFYHDLGYRFFKLGEEAIVPLETFKISGKKRAGLRATFNRFTREGYVFELHSPPFSEAFIKDIKEVSDAWLGKQHEKGFSLGYFDSSYLSRADIATLSDSEGKIVAFMNLMPMYQEGYISVDLMRYYPDSPSGIMDAMFVHLFQWAKEEGYQYFNAGMAPLSNVGQSQYAFLSERIAAVIFNNVNYMYSFSGLRRFKGKYQPIWKGKYLAFRKNRSLPVTMLIVTRLIGKGPKGKTTS